MLIAPILAARFAPAMSARPCGFRAGCIAFAITAGCCSSTCAIITGITQIVADPQSPVFALAETLKPEWVVRIDGEVVARTADTINPEPANRRGRGPRGRPRSAVRGEGAAAAGVRRAGLSRGDAAEIPLPRSPPREPARQHHEKAGHHLVAAQPHARGGVLRVPDPDPHRVLAGRRARLSRAVARASRASSMRCRRRRSNSSSSL